MKNIVSANESVKMQITESISENLTDLDLESIKSIKINKIFNSIDCYEVSRPGEINKKDTELSTVSEKKTWLCILTNNLIN